MFLYLKKFPYQINHIFYTNWNQISIPKWYINFPHIDYTNKFHRSSFTSLNLIKLNLKMSLNHSLLFVHNCISPDLACIILWSCNNCVSLVVEHTWKNLVLMSFQNLQFLSCLSIPKSCSLVKTSWQYFIALRVVYHFRNLTLMSFQYSSASKSWNTVNSTSLINTACY